MYSAVVVRDEEERLCKMYLFVTSMDLWTSGGGGHFLVVNYYGIICDDGSFDLWYGILDLPSLCLYHLCCGRKENK